MQLPIPFDYVGNRVGDFEVSAPRAGVLAETARAAEDGHYYGALFALAAGACKRLGEEEDSAQIKNMLREAPYRDIEWIALSAVVGLSPDDGFEGVYNCPRCGTQHVTAYSEEDDTRDFISDLEFRVAEEPDQIRVELAEPVEVRSKGEVIETVESITIRQPTLRDCMRAESRVGQSDPTRLQLGIYAEALVSVNDNDIDQSYRNRFGSVVMDRLTIRDLRTLEQGTSRWGLQTQIDKRCRKCGKEWKAPVNTMGFFESALR
jgi:hypothetical protein